MSHKNPIRNYEYKPAPTMAEKWGHKREACVKALRADWSVGAVVRAYEVPEKVIRTWQSEEKLPPYLGPKRPMPEVGQILT